MDGVGFLVKDTVQFDFFADKLTRQVLVIEMIDVLARYQDKPATQPLDTVDGTSGRRVPGSP